MNIFGLEINRVGSQPRSHALKSAIESRAATLASRDITAALLFGAESTTSGESVTEEGSMGIPAVYAAVRVLSEDVAGLPFKLYRRTSTGREEAREHPLWGVLHDRGNDLMTAFTLREVLMVHLLLWGNAYAEIEIDGAGAVRALWPIAPRRVEVKDQGRDLRYKVTMPGGEIRYFTKEQLLHIPGLGFDGVQGKSPIRLARESLGVSIAAEKYGAAFFKNDGTPGFGLKHPGVLSDKAMANLRQSFERRHMGAGNAHRVAIFEEGMEPVQVGLPPEDAQFIQTKKYGVTDVARVFRVPPHKIADLERATFSNIEAQGIDYVQSGLRPWLIRIEQAVSMRLLLPSERNEFYAEHTVDAFLRGDIQSRYEAYTKARQWGFMSTNEIRAKENMNPVDSGDVYLQPLNMVPAGSPPPDMSGDGARTSLPAVEVRRETREALPSRYGIAAAMEPVMLDVFRRAGVREIREIRAAVERHLVGGDRMAFADWLEEFREEHAEWMTPRIMPTYDMLARQMARAAEEEIGEAPDEAEMERFTRDYAETYAMRYTGGTQGQLRAVVNEEEDDPAGAVSLRLDEWAGNESNPARADKEARREQVRGMNAFTKAAWLTLGVVAHTWRTTGRESCPYCDEMNGRKVSITDFFVRNGDRVQDMEVYGDKGHPPLHDGCDCLTVPTLSIPRKRLPKGELRKAMKAML